MAGSKVFGIAGYQNSGKTTLIRKLIAEGKARGLSVGVIKHHGHGGELHSAVPEKDGGKFFDDGAKAVTVAGGTHLAVEAAKKEWELGELLELQAFFGVDVVLVEGFKHADVPKAVLIRDEADLHLLHDLDNIGAAVGDVPISASFPVFRREESGRFAAWFFEEFLQKKPGFPVDREEDD